MNTVKVRDESGNWIDICGCRRRLADNTWSTLIKQGDKVRDDLGNWITIDCGYNLELYTFWDNSKPSINENDISLVILDNTTGLVVGEATNPNSSDSQPEHNIHYWLLNDANNQTYIFYNNNSSNYVDIKLDNIFTGGIYLETQRLMPNSSNTFTNVPKTNMLIGLLST